MAVALEEVMAGFHFGTAAECGAVDLLGLYVLVYDRKILVHVILHHAGDWPPRLGLLSLT